MSTQCQACGREIKAGLRPAVVVQKAMGLGPTNRDDEIIPLFCVGCMDREEDEYGHDTH